MAFFEKFLEIRQREIARDPMTTVPVIARGDPSARKHYDMSIGIQVPRSSHRSVFLRLGKQVFLDNQTEEACPEDIVVVSCHPTISQEVLSSALVTGTSRWRYPRILPEHLSQASLEGKLGQNYEYSLDPPARRPARLPTPFQRRERRVEDHPVDPRRVEVRRRVKDGLSDPRRVEVPAPARCLPTLDLTEKTFLDRMEERLCLRR